MKIERKEITIRELADGYTDDGDDGVVGFGGKLDIRPPYQRAFVYKDKQRDDVVRSVLGGFPLNVMYWATRPDGRFEVLDGQQRTISIAQYVDGAFSIDGLYYNNQPGDVRERIEGYELMIYVCDGEASEKLKWFEIVNIAGEKLTKQELRNAVYAGPWVTEAKRYFSRPGCAAKGISDDYVKGSPIRQDLLETAIMWVSNDNIEDYMGSHQHGKEVDQLWTHFQAVIDWVKATFPKKRPSIMKNVDWGPLYRKHGNDAFDPDQLEVRIHHLLSLENNVIGKQAGIYAYMMDGDEQHLNLRAFDTQQKNTAYERQKGICKICRKKFEFREMEGDHITPWIDGGLTDSKNLQMLCKECNRRKGAG